MASINSKYSSAVHGKRENVRHTRIATHARRRPGAESRVRRVPKFCGADVAEPGRFSSRKFAKIDTCVTDIPFSPNWV